ncbi:MULTISPECIES: DNA-methyltransferase [unclassified Campylobacter]|uniref:DNA-methyltransferase n=1 Tax=unclassified Campylobacter TaxID=2593542 RepID=UPI001237CC33|nr:MULTISPECIES: site-specific DNA-methyltransferase [unclassified Campylobacter]KAA6226468.1 site-specific DNA-methyltransferase [Campylobacter sp. LR185c]KAA6228604.1 site-specific DNA-methyltransferase [Campylobacter sp. LR196d]KAA6229157.1 site-specific DNA-methyltransferase [Campylobacter sp. LR286c]KAA8603476.1 DNA methyltransferase [Campylobacter sp. LR185c]
MKKDIILQGDCVQILKDLPSKSVDLIFADPPYFMQTQNELLRVNGEKFNGVDDKWDKFESFEAYDKFCHKWLKECKRILKDNGSIWVIGSFQNIFRIGYIMQNLSFWVLNDIIWAKTNPVPNFKGTRFCNSHESLIWCAKNKNSKYTFNYKTMKFLNNNKQEKSVWNLALCTGNERLKDKNNKKLHSTQKPELLLEKIILSSSKEKDLILDPFFGTGTTGAVARRLGRHFLGIEKNKIYIDSAKIRIKNIKTISNELTQAKLEIKPPRISLESLKKVGLLKDNEKFYDKNKNFICTLKQDNKVRDKKELLSIHKMAAKHLNKKNHNGWNFFYVLRNDALKSIDSLRYEYEK